MSGVSIGCAVVFVVAAGANWWSRWTDDRRTELWSKPLALIALIGVAATLDPVDPAVRAWFVVALVFSLAGDVFLLDGDRRFIPGLVAFLLAHVAYTIGLIVAPDWSWVGFVVGVVIMVVLAAAVGLPHRRRRPSIRTGARPSGLGLPRGDLADVLHCCGDRQRVGDRRRRVVRRIRLGARLATVRRLGAVDAGDGDGHLPPRPSRPRRLPPLTPWGHLPSQIRSEHCAQRNVRSEFRVGGACRSES